jgi:hypothetical protein
MATLKPALSLTMEYSSTGVTTGEFLINISDELSTAIPNVNLSTVTVTTTGGDNVIVPSVDSCKYVYVKHKGINAAGDSSGTDKVRVETADGTQIAELQSGEFMFFPYYGGGACKIQLEASANTCQAEYGYWTRG